MRSPETTFRILGLCASPPGTGRVSQRLRHATIGVESWEELVRHAEHAGLDPLFRAHLAEAGVPLPSRVVDRLNSRWMQHAHAAAVRTRVVTGVLRAMDDAGIPVLLLKGAALAQLVYARPLLRPMRDIDVLIRARDTPRAARVLEECGFAVAGPEVPPGHHHARPMSTTVDGATMTIELHQRLLPSTPFIRPVEYDDVCRDAQAFDWEGRQVRALGREHMLWHVYAHAFAINVTRPAIRLASVADLVMLTEAWVDEIDWEKVRRHHRVVWHGLPLLHHLTPWSPRVLETLQWDVRRRPDGVRATVPRLSWSVTACRDVLWPAEWWLGLRYGVRGRFHRVWCRMAAHPIRLLAAAVRRRQRGRGAESH